MHQDGDKTPLDCGPFVDAGSVLAEEIASYQTKGCETRYGPQGRYVESLEAVGLSKRNVTEETKDERGLILIYRYFNSDESAVPVSPEDIKGNRNFRVISENLPTQLLNAEGPGRVARFETDHNDVTRVCVTGIARNPNKSRTIVEICQPVAVFADDTAAMERAQQIAAEYFAAVNP